MQENEIKSYWANRAEGYSQVNQEELQGIQRKTWSEFLNAEIEAHFPSIQRKEIKIMDIGAGPGFLSIILAESGYSVTACDYTKEMLEQAKRNASELAEKIRFVCADAQNLSDFLDHESAHVIICRNLIWNLKEPEKAYSNFYEVLKKNGLLMIFDANWYAYLFDEKKKAEYEQDRINVAKNNLDDFNIGKNFDRMEKMALEMPLSQEKRPLWDKKILEQSGFSKVDFQLDVGRFLYSEKEKINYASTPMFCVEAIK
ncbi:MAG: methyltransferase domain-containing protein [Treponemataceae bacterium]|nr:methyltransferase domain-containing protein [Treponemataceae bacterium]